MATQRHLRVLDGDVETGEVHTCEHCAPLRTEVEGHLDNIRGLNYKLSKLKRDLDAEARADKRWPVGKRLFIIWQRVTERPGTKWKWDRFGLVEGFLKDGSTGPDEALLDPGPPRNDFEKCAAAIIGRGLDCFSTKRKNGKVQKFNEWERIFKNSGEMDESMERRPRDWRERLAELDPGEQQAGPVRT